MLRTTVAMVTETKLKIQKMANLNKYKVKNQSMFKLLTNLFGKFKYLECLMETEIIF